MREPLRHGGDAPSNPRVHKRRHCAECLIVAVDHVAEAFRERAEVLQLTNGVLDDDAHTRKLTVDRFLVLRQRMIPSRFVGRAHAMVRQLVMQSLVASITCYANLLGNPV
jgi:hypothetical protein